MTSRGLTAEMPAAGTRATAPAASRTRSGSSFGTTYSYSSSSSSSNDEESNDHGEQNASKPQLKSRKSATEWIDTDRRNSAFFLRSSPSRNRVKYWNRSKSAVVSASTTRKNIAVSGSTSHGLDAAPMPRISKTEFQNLPSSVQRKVSSIFLLAFRKSSRPSLRTNHWPH